MSHHCQNQTRPGSKCRMRLAGKVRSVKTVGNCGPCDKREGYAPVERTRATATTQLQAIAMLHGNVGCMRVNRMVDKKMAKDTEDSKEYGQFTDNTHTRRHYNASQKRRGSTAPPSGRQLLVLSPARPETVLGDGGKLWFRASCPTLTLLAT